MTARRVTSHKVDRSNEGKDISTGHYLQTCECDLGGRCCTGYLKKDLFTLAELFQDETLSELSYGSLLGDVYCAEKISLV